MENNLIGLIIILALNLLLIALCVISIKIIFKKYDLKNEKNFRKNLKTAISNAFCISSLISIIGGLIIYIFLPDILKILNLKTGLINYTIYASKIWFVSSPFIGLEITIFNYFYEIKYSSKIFTLIVYKFLTYVLLSFILYFKYHFSSIFYAKPICDIVFLIYYSKICFELTMKNILN